MGDDSPDWKGDLVVNMADLGELGIAYATGYDFAWDLVYDGVINFADIAEFGLHLGEACP